MSTLPAVPPVPDSDRYFSATLGITTVSVTNVPFPVYGDGTDLDVRFNGASMDPSLWSFVSAAAIGAPLSSLPRPITDGQVLFSPPIFGGLLEIEGVTHPRRLSMPTAPGIARRELNQTVGHIVSTLRELYRAVRAQKASAGIKFDATGPLTNRSIYDAAIPPFLFLQTDDAQSRPVYYAKLSVTPGAWSGPLVPVGPPGPKSKDGIDGTNGVNGAYAATDAVVGSIAPTDYVPIQSGGVSKRVLRDNLLAATAPGRRVAALWDGDGQGSVNVTGSAAIVIMADGTARGWGLGADNGNGDASASNRWVPKTIQIAAANATKPTLPWVQAARCGSSAWLLDSAGLVYAVGGNAVGQLGLGDTVARTQLTLVAALQTIGPVASIVAQQGSQVSGGSTVFFIMASGQLYATGGNVSGQIGDGTTAARALPQRCGALVNIVKVQAGVDYLRNNFVMALDGAGNLYAWGDNTYGQLGDGTATSRASPYLTLTGVADFGVTEAYNNSPQRGGHAVVVNLNGTVSTVGYNGVGQLGLGDTTNRPNWSVVAGIATAKKAFAGAGVYGATMVVLADGTLRVWGGNGAGQLGLGTTASQLTPATPAGAFQGKVASVQIFGWFGLNTISTALLCTDGTVWATGYNGGGALGQSNGFTNLTTFALVTLPPGATSPAAAIKFNGTPNTESSLYVLLADGSLWATGGNSDGRLGTQVGNLHNVDGLEQVIFT